MRYAVATTPYFTTLAFLKFTKIAIARNRYETILQFLSVAWKQNRTYQKTIKPI
ncbi:MAG: hypothetical protein ACK53Q_01805 [Dolichospermum sp.]